MQISRLIEIIYLLLDKEKVTAEELAERFEISVRTVYRDIEALSIAGFPVYAERGRNGGIKICDGYSLNKSLLTRDEQTEIIGSLKALSAVNGSNQQALDRLTAFFGDRYSVLDWVEIDFSDWNNSHNDMFEKIKQCIFDKRIISFDYYNSNCEKTHRSVCPVKLLFKSRTWYLYGYCLTKKAMRVFKLVRMKRVETGDICDSDFEIDEIRETFAQKIPIEKITLKISNKMAYRVFDNFDENEIIKNDDGSVTVNCEFPIDNWVYGMILSYGEYCEVISPEYIRNEVREKISNMYNIYNKT